MAYRAQRVPTERDKWLRRVKTGVRQAARLAGWGLLPSRWPSPERAVDDVPWTLVHEARIPIRRDDADADPRFEAGKLTNLALAAPCFDGLLVLPERPLSFCRTLGRPSYARGFVDGMELRGGCIVPSVGGGICLLSNAIFEMALVLGWTVLERHGHSMQAVPPRPGELWGIDATVLWPHVDLRIAPRTGRAKLGVRVRAETLHLSVHAAEGPTVRARLSMNDDRVVTTPAGTFRQNRVVRRLEHAGSGRVEEETIIAVNHKRVLDVTARRRSCHTCGETGCAERPRGQGR
jgi:vancomycin resistance protein VanW